MVCLEEQKKWAVLAENSTIVLVYINDGLKAVASNGEVMPDRLTRDFVWYVHSIFDPDENAFCNRTA